MVLLINNYLGNTNTYEDEYSAKRAMRQEIAIHNDNVWLGNFSRSIRELNESDFTFEFVDDTKVFWTSGKHSSYATFKNKNIRVSDHRKPADHHTFNNNIDIDIVLYEGYTGHDLATIGNLIVNEVIQDGFCEYVDNMDELYQRIELQA